MTYSIHRIDKSGTVNPDTMAEEATLESALTTAGELGGNLVIIGTDGTVVSEKGRAMEVDIPWLDNPVPVPAKPKSRSKGNGTKPTRKKRRDDDTEKLTNARPVDPLDVLNDILEPDKAPAKSQAEEVVPVQETPTKKKGSSVTGLVDSKDAGDFLMWIGSNNATTIDGFLETVKTRGIAKKLSKLPYDLVVGVSTIFLVHDEGSPENAVIFGRYVITGIQVTVADMDNPVLPDKIDPNDPRVEIVLASERMPEGIYALGRKVEVFENCFDYAGIFGKTAQRFRGYKRVDAVGILNSELYKPRPSAAPRLQVDLPDGYVYPKEGDPWTEEERQALMRHVEVRGDRAQAFREFSHATGRSKEAVSYQYYRFLRNSKAT